MQVIATTHSPLTAQQASEGELFALKKENGKVTLVPFIGNPQALLLHQMLMSPVFGLETDESFEVQKQKEKYKVLKSKSNRTVKEKKELSIIGADLKEISVHRSNSLLSRNDKQLLRDIKSAISKK